MAKKKSTKSANQKKRVSKDQWVQVALETLQEEGVEGVKIERLARSLGIAKAGFYWHFSDRDELLSDMLEFWTREYTEIVTKGLPKLAAQPRQRLLETMKMIAELKLNKYELPMLSWAAIDENAAKAVRKVYDIRFKYLRAIFEELGFRGADMEMRAKMFLVYYSLSPVMYPMDSRAKRAQLMKKQLDWFCKK